MVKLAGGIAGLLIAGGLLLRPHLRQTPPAEAAAAQVAEQPKAPASLRSPTTSTPAPEPAAEGLPARLAQLRDVQATRARLDAVLATEVSALRSVAQVDAYLSLLEARARSQAQVTVLEVEPGWQAISLLALTPDQRDAKLDEFSQRMAALSAALRPDHHRTREDERQ